MFATDFSGHTYKNHHHTASSGMKKRRPQSVTSEEDDDDYEEEELVIDLKESDSGATDTEGAKDHIHNEDDEEEEATFDTTDEENSNNGSESINGSRYGQSSRANNLNNFGENKRRSFYSMKYESASMKNEPNE